MQDKTISEMTMQPRDYSPAFAAWQQSARNVIYRPDHFEDPLFGIIEGRLAGTPCVFDKRLAFREGEVTMWAGQNGNGKSLLTGQVALQLLAAGQKVGIQSFEMTPARTLFRMLRQGWGRLPTKYDAQANEKKIQAFLAYCRDAGLLLSNEKQAITIEGVLGVSVVMAKEFGCKHIFIDNLMKVVHAEDDYTGQKEFVQGCCQIARELSVHIHIVHHVRKAGSERDEIDKFAVRGSSAIVDQIDNLVLIRRNLDKERLAEERELTPTEDQDSADALLRISKQRNGDFMGLVPLWFDKRGAVFCTSAERALPRLLPEYALPADCFGRARNLGEWKMTDRKRMAPRVLEYKLTAALRTLQEVAQALEAVLEIRGVEGWHRYDKTDEATHPPKGGGYLVTLKGPTGHLSVEVRPFDSGKGFAGDWSRYSVQAWRSIPKPYGAEEIEA